MKFEKVYLMFITVNHDGNESMRTDVFETFDKAIASMQQLTKQIEKRWDKNGDQYEIEKNIHKEIPVAYWSIRKYGYEFEYYEEIHIGEYVVH